MKRRIVILLMLLSGVFLYGCQRETSSPNENLKVNNVDMHIYLYNENEIPHQYDITQNNYYLFVVSMSLDNNDIDLNELNVSSKDMDSLGKRIKELENDSQLTKDIFFDRVEFKENKQYYYFVYEIDKKIDEGTFNIKNIEIQYKEELFEVPIPIYMTL